jgi:FkbM family methyltransferase
MKYKSNQERTAEYLERIDRSTVLRSLVGNSPVIFDVGANIGQTLTEFKQLWPKAEVHCFEPLVEFYNKLHTTSANYNKVICNNFALSDTRSESKTFYYHKVQPMLSGFEQININSKDSVAINDPKLAGLKQNEFVDNVNDTTTVRTETLDYYMGYNDIDHVDILKMDIQGAEPKVLKGAKERLGNFDIILTELNFYDLYKKQVSFYDIEQYLKPAGFKLFDISHISKNPINGRTDWVDVIYTK